MRRTDDLVAIDFADQARLLDLRHLIGGQRHILLQTERRLRVGEVIIDAVLEGDAYERQSVERRGADIVYAGRRVQPDFHRGRIVFFHLLSGEAGRLRGDLENDRRGIRIGFDIELRIRNHPGDDEYEQAQ